MGQLDLASKKGSIVDCGFESTLRTSFFEYSSIDVNRRSEEYLVDEEVVQIHYLLVRLKV